MTFQQPTPQDRTVATLIHLSIFLNFLVFLSGIIVALVVALLYRDRSAFVARHAFQSLLFQIALAIIALLLLGLVAALWVGTFVVWLPWAVTWAEPPRGAPPPGPAQFVWILAWALTVGFSFVTIVLLVVGLVLPIVAAIRANRGEEYTYPLVGRLMPTWWYSS